jgi:hypothetical protein
MSSLATILAWLGRLVNGNLDWQWLFGLPIHALDDKIARAVNVWADWK